MTEPAQLAATRAAYDDMADRYAEFIETDLVDKPMDRGMHRVQRPDRRKVSFDVYHCHPATSPT